MRDKEHEEHHTQQKGEYAESADNQVPAKQLEINSEVRNNADRTPKGHG